MSRSNIAGSSSDEMIDWSSAPKDSLTVEIPDVTGWRILVIPLEVISKTAGGIVISEETQQKEQLIVTVGRVLQLGPKAYSRPDMGDPWCAEGDLVGYGKYAGKKMHYKGIPLVILNDDEVLMTFPE